MREQACMAEAVAVFSSSALACATCLALGTCLYFSRFSPSAALWWLLRVEGNEGWLWMAQGPTLYLSSVLHAGSKKDIAAAVKLRMEDSIIPCCRV